MPLRIQLKKDQKIIINGAVIENISGRSVSLLLKNNAAVLRDADILVAEEANTPASRVYFQLQCIYLFPANKGQYLPSFNEYLDSFEQAVPTSKDLCAEIRAQINEGNYYRGLKLAHQLIAREGRILADVEEQIVRQLHETAAAGEPEGNGSLGPDAGGGSAEPGEGGR